MSKFVLRFVCILLLVIIFKIIFVLNQPILRNEIVNNVVEKINPLKPKLSIEKIIISSDKDNDGILDLDDIVQGARKDAEVKPAYKDAYYSGGYPPDNEGVCTDVVWRAFKNAGYDFKKMIDEDIKKNTSQYPRVGSNPEPNIDFRRVQNLISYFKRYGTILTTEIIPGDVENLKYWQAGDIVVFDNPYEHVGIISDIRRDDGVPYMIHNGGPYTKEEDALLYWNDNISKIIWHFRFPKV